MKIRDKHMKQITSDTKTKRNKIIVWNLQQEGLGARRWLSQSELALLASRPRIGFQMLLRRLSSFPTSFARWQS